MKQRLGVQRLNVMGLSLCVGILCLASAEAAWVTQGMLQGGKPSPQPCAAGNPYCAAQVNAPPGPRATFNEAQEPCDNARDACAQAYSQAMTKNYQQGVTSSISPPYIPCAMDAGCSSVEPWWKSTVVVPIEQKTIPYDPGRRPWTEKKSCGTQFVGGVYTTKPCP